MSKCPVITRDVPRNTRLSIYPSQSRLPYFPVLSYLRIYQRATRGPQFKATELCEGTRRRRGSIAKRSSLDFKHRVVLYRDQFSEARLVGFADHLVTDIHPNWSLTHASLLLIR